MQLTFQNTPQPENFSSEHLPTELLAFLTAVPNFELLESLSSKYQSLDTLVLVANGGSSNTFVGYHGLFSAKSSKRVFFIQSPDPAYISEVLATATPERTLVLSISKSGENVAQLEAMSQFAGYPMLVVTTATSPLAQIARGFDAEVIDHPPIGGRYTGLTDVGLLPAALCGFDVRAIFAGGRSLQDQFESSNIAWEAASVFWQLEQSGHVDVFVPLYSHGLASTGLSIQQICHESFGKSGLGQSYITLEAPEWQHHSAQRFFGGRKNVAGFFVRTAAQGNPRGVSYPEGALSAVVRGNSLSDIQGIPLTASLGFEVDANLSEALRLGIPTATLSVDASSETAVGEFTAFWQLFAVYSSVLRGVDPFDQPAVESSKAHSHAARVSYKA